MLRLIALRGISNGSAALKTNQNGTAVELRGRLKPAVEARLEDGTLEAFLVNEKGEVKPMRFSGGVGTCSIIGACGMLIMDENGQCVTEGASGVKKNLLLNAKTKIAFMNAPMLREKDLNPSVIGAAEKPKSEPARSLRDSSTGKSEGSALSGDGSLPNSEAARAIIAAAQELFHKPVLNNKDSLQNVNEIRETFPDRNSGKKQKLSTNPFPDLFRNAEWYLDPGSDELQSTVRVNGRRMLVTAVPFKNSDKSCGKRGMRAAKSADGRVYCIMLESAPAAPRTGGKNGVNTVKKDPP